MVFLKVENCPFSKYLNLVGFHFRYYTCMLDVFYKLLDNMSRLKKTKASLHLYNFGIRLYKRCC